MLLKVPQIYVKRVLKKTGSYFVNQAVLNLKENYVFFLSGYIYDSCITHLHGTRSFIGMQMFLLLWYFVAMIVLPETSDSQNRGVMDQLRKPKRGNAKHTRTHVTKGKYCPNPRHIENTVKEANLSAQLYNIWQHNKTLSFLFLLFPTTAITTEAYAILTRSKYRDIYT